MNTKTAAAAALRRSRRFLRAMRSLSPASVIAVTLALVFGGAGIASATTGPNSPTYFILGQSNTETSEAYLNNSNGVPLKLVAPANDAPLRVSNANLVTSLNANYVGGYSAAQVVPYGGAGNLPNGTTVPIGSANQQVASTGQLSAGTYFVTATAQMGVLSPNDGGYCYISAGSNPQAEIQQGGTDQTGNIEAAETAAVTLTQPDTLQEWCHASGSSPAPPVSYVYFGAITAMRVLQNSGGSQTGTGAHAHPHMPARQGR
jgi:hypothetical protein